jgi:hypothetical protein
VKAWSDAEELRPWDEEIQDPINEERGE